MIMLTPSQHTLLHLLEDGACHSGNELGLALKISRSAIWKQINQLITLGIPVVRHPNKGYQLSSPMKLLNQAEIVKYLNEKNTSTPFNIHTLISIDSTNRYLKDLPASSYHSITLPQTQTNSTSTTAVVNVCCAEIQTQGRGRFGRNWHSPFGENIYCSSMWNLNCDLSKLSGLSLITSLATLASIKALNIDADIKIKWPNDILWNDKKLCGSLIEIIAESNGNAQVIIGIGLNVNTDTHKHLLPDKPWCSLYEMTQQYYDRNLIVANLLFHLERYLGKFIKSGLSVFMDEWMRADYLIGKEITVHQPTGFISGIACGINDSGLLILEDENKLKHYLSSGDTTLQRTI